MTTRRPASRTLAVACLAALGLSAVGCAETRTLRESHAPTYSYMHDADARAEVDLWPQVPTAAGYEVVAISERE